MKKTSKFFAAVMAIIMVVAAIPMTAFAADYKIEIREQITVNVPENGYAYCEFVPDKDGKYVVYSEYYPEHTDPTISVKDFNGDEIAASDDSVYTDNNDFYCIFDAQAGKSYRFELGEYDGKKTEYDITLMPYGRIVHQPTADEPYVGITKDSVALYQWCKIGETEDITDKDAEPCEGETGSGIYSTYDSSNGWTGVYNGKERDGYAGYNLLSVKIEAGQTIQMTSDCYADLFGFKCECGKVSLGKLDVDKNEPAPYTASHSCKYIFHGFYKSVPHVKAEMIKDYSELDGETGSELETSEAGKYLCLVSFDGCRLKYSEVFELDGSTPDLGSKRIKNADISIRTDIAGMHVSQYEDYIDILTANLQFEDNYGDAAIFVYDENGYAFSGNFVSGKKYQVEVYLTPDAGYKLSNSIAGTVNGMGVACYIDEWEPGGQYGDVVVDYVALEFEITVSNPCSHMCHQGGIAGFFWSIINFFNRLFGLNPFCECGSSHY